jgi:hypothetical protein
LPLPVQIRTRVCEPIVFERYGSEAARDRDYVDACFDLVTNQMQEQLDCLVGYWELHKFDRPKNILTAQNPARKPPKAWVASASRTDFGQNFS